MPNLSSKHLNSTGSRETTKQRLREVFRYGAEFQNRHDHLANSAPKRQASCYSNFKLVVIGFNERA